MLLITTAQFLGIPGKVQVQSTCVPWFLPIVYTYVCAGLEMSAVPLLTWGTLQHLQKALDTNALSQGSEHMMESSYAFGPS